MKMKHILLILLFFLGFSRSMAQTPTYAITSNNLPEPNSAAGTFSGNNYSVDLFTGIANVSVPIYSNSVDGLDLGISINYNTKGITVDQIASEIGLGWDLQAGGRITRIVNGLEDEFQSTLNYVDNEGDYYIAEFGGRTLKFLHASGKTPTFPKSEIAASIDGNTTINGLTFFTWKITDEKGNVFEFHKVNYLWKVFNGTEYYPAYQWLLTKVITYSGQVVTYTYSDYELNYSDFEDQKLTEIRIVGSPPTWDLYDITDTLHIWHGIQSHLTEIDYPNGDKVNFSMAASSAKRCDLYNNYYLDSITISNSYDSYVGNSQTFRFNYAYFNAPPGSAELPFSTSCSSANNDLRLKLKSIDKVGNDHGVAEPYYSFDYNSTQLPRRMSPYQDWFGYFNNKTCATTTFNSNVYFLSVPQHYYTDNLGNNSTLLGEDRSSDINYIQACVLSKVVSGTGEEINLAYQRHSLSDEPVSSDVYASPSDFDNPGANDGLCISSITYRDGFNQDDVINTFSFSNGYRFYKGGYFWYAVYYNASPYNPAALPQLRFYTNHFITPYDFFNNSNHGYSNVTVSTSAYKSALGNEVPLSTTKYQFTNIVNEVTGRSRLVDDKTVQYKSAFPRDSMQQSEMGLLMRKQQYDNVGNLISIDTFQYEKNNLASGINFLNTRTLLDSFWDAAKVNYDTVFPSREYTQFDMSMMRVKYKTSTTFSAGTAYTNTIQYTWDDADNLTNISWTDSRGVHYNKAFVYTYNYFFTSPSGPIYYLPGVQHLTTTLLSEHTIGSDSVVSAQIVKGVQNSVGLVFPYAYSSKSSVPFIRSYVEDGNIIQAGTIYWDHMFLASETTTYDDHNNPLETKYLNQDRYNSAIWDTRIGKKIVNVSNAKYNDIAYTSFEGPFLSSGIDYNKGNWNFSPTHVVYAPYTGSTLAVTGRYYYSLTSGTGGITSKNSLTSGKQYLLSFWAIDAPTVTNGGSGVTITAQATKGSWTLYSALITGAGSALTLSFPTVTYIDELRLYPADASMNTYTYEPLFGISSECDDHNNIIYHDYDAFGREKVTRDINGNVITLTRHTIHGSDN